MRWFFAGDFKALTTTLSQLDAEGFVALYQLRRPTWLGLGSEPELVLVRATVSGDFLKSVSGVRRLLSKFEVQLSVFTSEELISSSDVFPIEFMDLKAHGELLAGRDVRDSFALSSIHLRHQCELNLRSYLLKLREGVIRGQSPSRLIHDSLPKVLNTLRYLLGDSAAKVDSIPALIVAVENALHVDGSVFGALVSTNAGEPLFGAYMTALEDIISKVDQF